MSAVNESVKKFYTINIPSLATEITPGNATVPVVEILLRDKQMSCWNLKAGEHVVLPPCLCGRPPVLDSDELKEQEIKWVMFYGKAHPSKIVSTVANLLAVANVFGTANVWAAGHVFGGGNVLGGAFDASVGFLENQPFYETSECETYSLGICATPGCHRKIPMAEQSDHLNLCVKHRTELDALLKNYQKSYGIVIPEDASVDDVHNMIYYFLLPSIDQLTKRLSESADQHERYVAQVLLALKACIYLYRMHLNPMASFIQTIVRLFLNALNQSEATMRQLVSAILKLIIVPFAICGIFIVWSADLILSDDRHLSIILMAAGAGVGFWGWTSYADAAGAILVGPIAAVAAGAALLGIGVSMLIQRLQRRAPHEYVVRAHVNLDGIDGYLQQWIRNAF